MRRTLLAALSLCLFTGCKKDTAGPTESGPFAPGAATLLSTGSPTKDEDPSVIRTADGRMLVAWFSDRGGNSDLYLISTADGATWSPPARLTTSPAGDFYPSLYQDDQGTIHLVWFRWTTLEVGSIWHATSVDGTAWSAETQVTSVPGVDDWVPTITRRRDGALLVYFSSRKRGGGTFDLYVSVRQPGSPSWQPAVALTALNSPTFHDHLPVVVNANGAIVLVWVRNDTRNLYPWNNPKADVFGAASADGLTWPAPTQVTNEAGDVVNIFPSLYRKTSGDWWIEWLSTRTGTPRVFEIPVATASQYPNGRLEIGDLPPGYTHRIAESPKPGVYLGVWVQGPDGTQDIYYRFFRR